jgi:hypothetical protein
LENMIRANFPVCSSVAWYVEVECEPRKLYVCSPIFGT